MGGDGLSDIRTFSLFPFTAEAVRLLNRCGVLVYVVTNQSHIAKGSITQAQFDERVSEMATELAAQGAGIDGLDRYSPYQGHDRRLWQPAWCLCGAVLPGE